MGDLAVALLEAAAVDQRGDALARGDAERVAALGAHAARALDLRAVHDLLARVALDPQPLGDVHLLGRPGRLLGLAPEPGHARLTATRSGALRAAMSSPKRSISAEVPACASIVRTMAEPTATPSARRADGGHLLRRGHAEADAHGLGGHEPQRADLHVRGPGAARAGRR